MQLLYIFIWIIIYNLRYIFIGFEIYLIYILWIIELLFNNIIKNYYVIN